MSVRRHGVACCIAILLLLHSGCGEQAGRSGQNGKKYLVIFSQCNNAEPYRTAQNDLMTELWAAKGDVTFEIADAQQDNSKQIAQIETAMLRKPDLLIVAPNETGPLTKVMGEAVEEGLKVLCLEREILEPNYTTYIGSDNREIGRLAGQFVVDRLYEKHGAYRGKIIHLCGLAATEGEVNRYGGAQQVISQYPDIEVLAAPVANWLQSLGRERMTEVLSVHPEIDLVYGHNDPMAVGAYLAAKDVDREREIIFIGVDGLKGPAGGIQKVVDGVLAATFVYPLCVDKAVEIGDRILRDPDFVPEDRYTIESTMVTRENAAELLAE